MRIVLCYMYEEIHWSKKKKLHHVSCMVGDIGIVCGNNNSGIDATLYVLLLPLWNLIYQLSKRIWNIKSDV